MAVIINQSDSAAMGCAQGQKYGLGQKGTSLFVGQRGLPSATLGSQNMAQNIGSLFLTPKRDLGGPKRDLVCVVSITASFLS